MVFVVGAMDAEIGIIGSYGIHEILTDAEETDADTKYGKPSSAVSVGAIGGRKVALIARHGKRHTIPPHTVPYLANMQALKDLGVKRVISTATVGSLKTDYKPGEFVLFDQFVNMSRGRKDTIFDGSQVTHVSTANPYCPEMRLVVSKASIDMDINLHNSGTIVVIDGPRFSTKAESKMFSDNGMDVINMTQYPEVALAREMGLCFIGIGTITDYDAGLEGADEETKPVSFDEVQKRAVASAARLKQLLNYIVPKIPEKRSCSCSDSLKGAVVKE